MGRLHVTPTSHASDDEESFDYFGATIRIAGDFGEPTFVDFMEQWGDVDENDPRTVVAGKRLMQAMIHPDDFAVFWSKVRTHRQGTADLMALCEQIVEAVTGRPTGRPGDSSAGRTNTPAKSGDDTFSRVMERERGRPDRQLGLWRAEQARRARERQAG